MASDGSLSDWGLIILDDLFRMGLLLVRLSLRSVSGRRAEVTTAGSLNSGSHDEIERFAVSHSS